VDRIIHLVSELADRGRDPLSILESLLYRLADLTRAAYGVESGLESAREAALHEMATKVGVKAILAMRSDLAEAHKIIRDISIPRLWMESELIRISQNLSKSERVHEAKPEPRQEPKVVAAPAPKAEPPAKAVVTPAPSARTGDDPWSRTYAELAAMSKLMSIRLKDARLDTVEGTEYVIAFERQMDLEWVQEQPKRLVALTETFRKHASPEATLRLVAAGKKPAPPPEASAVELPLEGKALHEAASEIMRGQL
jgi:DNA polymerase-3 subunit gamma/tau